MRAPLFVVSFLLLNTSIVFSYAGEKPMSDSTGLAGDNFNLEAALDLFKNSSSLEDFEQKLNTQDNQFNNLDLNGDGQVDYIKVTDHMEGNTHAIGLQTPVSDNESQDIAVITVEKTGDATALVQIVGDEDLYGKEKIVEPHEYVSTEKNTESDDLYANDQDAATNNNNNTSNNNNSRQRNVYVNVWGWPSVSYLYGPRYVAYAPAWRWGVYPSYYRPWRPRPWAAYYSYVHPYRRYYRPVYFRRAAYAPALYRPYRSSSVIVRNRYQVNNTTVIRNNSNFNSDRRAMRQQNRSMRSAGGMGGNGGGGRNRGGVVNGGGRRNGGGGRGRGR